MTIINNYDTIKNCREIAFEQAIKEFDEFFNMVSIKKEKLEIKTYKSF